MAAGSLLLLIDDIAALLDDVSVMTKVAVKKTAGVLGDDLALNAQQVSGVDASRELPVVWAVAKGSLRNKAILVPAALAIGTFAPWGITPLLMVGGAFLCYEGFEKIAHRFMHAHDAQGEDEAHKRRQRAAALADPKADMAALEKDKIEGAVRTDFILSAEIIAITLGAVAGAPFVQQLTVLVAIALAMTVGVYGFVAGIVKLDDAGLYLSRQQGAGAWATVQRGLGRLLLTAAPWLMRALSIAGTAAMFLVGGGILVHGAGWLGRLSHDWSERAGDIPAIGTVLGAATPMLINATVGVLAGGVVLGAVTLFRRVTGGRDRAAA